MCANPFTNTTANTVTDNIVDIGHDDNDDDSGFDENRNDCANCDGDKRVAVDYNVIRVELDSVDERIARCVFRCCVALLA